MRSDLENKIEQFLVKETLKRGGIAYKFVSPGRRGVPDRLCVFPNGTHIFVEVKTAVGVLSKLQIKEIERLTERGQPVAVVHSKQEILELMENIT